MRGPKRKVVSVLLNPIFWIVVNPIQIHHKYFWNMWLKIQILIKWIDNPIQIFLEKGIEQQIWNGQVLWLY